MVAAVLVALVDGLAGLPPLDGAPVGAEVAELERRCQPDLAEPEVEERVREQEEDEEEDDGDEPGVLPTPGLETSEQGHGHDSRLVR